MSSKANLLIGVGLLVVGAIWLLNNVGAMDFDFGDFISQAWPVAIILVGVWLLFGSRKRSVVKGEVSAQCVSHTFGDMDIAPEIIKAEGLEVKMSAGEVHLDLSDTKLQEKENLVEVKIGFGDVRIKAPRDVPLWAEGKTGIGDLHLIGRSADGFAARLEHQDQNYADAVQKLHIVAKAGLGDVRVTRR